MPIDAALFAHINNDAFLAGTYKLQGNLFSNTIDYLNGYFKSIQTKGEQISPKYEQLMLDLKYTHEVEG